MPVRGSVRSTAQMTWLSTVNVSLCSGVSNPRILLSTYVNIGSSSLAMSWHAVAVAAPNVSVFVLLY
jgi:hypothetical protein